MFLINYWSWIKKIKMEKKFVFNLNGMVAPYFFIFITILYYKIIWLYVILIKIKLIDNLLLIEQHWIKHWCIDVSELLVDNVLFPKSVFASKLESVQLFEENWSQIPATLFEEPKRKQPKIIMMKIIILYSSSNWLYKDIFKFYCWVGR